MAELFNHCNYCGRTVFKYSYDNESSAIKIHKINYHFTEFFKYKNKSHLADWHDRPLSIMYNECIADIKRFNWAEEFKNFCLAQVLNG